MYKKQTTKNLQVWHDLKWCLTRNHWIKVKMLKSQQKTNSNQCREWSWSYIKWLMIYGNLSWLSASVSAKFIMANVIADATWYYSMHCACSIFQNPVHRQMIYFQPSCSFLCLTGLNTQIFFFRLTLPRPKSGSIPAIVQRFRTGLSAHLHANTHKSIWCFIKANGACPLRLYPV